MGIRIMLRTGASAFIAATLVMALAPPARSEEPAPTTTTTTTATVTEATTTTTTVASEVVAPKPKPKIKFVPVKRYDVKRKLVFPIIGITQYWSGFGACRDSCNREHHGIDIMTYGYKGLPVVAAHDGTVTTVTYDKGNAGCSVRIRGRDRWETRYLHLNNDQQGTDNKGAPCPAPGIEVGSKVVAGQIIGYVGDSGNSEDTAPHLHFELRSRSGYPIDPYRSLKASRKVTFEWLAADAQTATIALNAKSRMDDVTSLVMVSSDEFASMAHSETDPLLLDSPIVSVDKSNPIPAIEEVDRLDPDRIVILSDSDAYWLEQLVRPHAAIVAIAPLPLTDVDPYSFEPDALEPEAWIANPTDRFTTVIAGAVDKIWRSKRAAYEAYIRDHQSVVLVADYWAPKNVGQRLWSSPGKWADRSLLWWQTGEGWVGTAPGEQPPHPGIAYVTEKRAVSHTLNYLGSLAELPPYPVWKSS